MANDSRMKLGRREPRRDPSTLHLAPRNSDNTSFRTIERFVFETVPLRKSEGIYNPNHFA
jgi:hypothetical protein